MSEHEAIPDASAPPHLSLQLPAAELERVRAAARSIAALKSTAAAFRETSESLTDKLSADRDKLAAVSSSIENEAADELLDGLLGPTTKTKKPKLTAEKARLEAEIPATIAAIRRLGPMVEQADRDALEATKTTGHLFADLVSALQVDPAKRVREALAVFVESFHALATVEAIRRRIVPAEFLVEPGALLPFGFDYEPLLRRLVAPIPDRFRIGVPDPARIVRSANSAADSIVTEIFKEESHD